MTFISQLSASIGDPIWNIFYPFVYLIPTILLISIVVFSGWLLGVFFSHVVKNMLKKMNITKKLKNYDAVKPISKVDLPALFAWITKWYIFVVFLAAASAYINLDTIANLIQSFSQWFAKFIIAIVIALIGLVFSEFVYQKILLIELNGIKLMAEIGRWFVLIFTTVVALEQIIRITLIKDVMLIVVGAISLALALAFGLSFGFALKDEAKNLVSVSRMQKQPKEKRKSKRKK